MVCLHWPRPRARQILRPIRLDYKVMCRSAHTAQRPRQRPRLRLIPLGTVPNSIDLGLGSVSVNTPLVKLDHQSFNKFGLKKSGLKQQNNCVILGKLLFGCFDLQESSGSKLSPTKLSPVKPGVSTPPIIGVPGGILGTPQLVTPALVRPVLLPTQQGVSLVRDKDGQQRILVRISSFPITN